jgi:hypothetical protein
MTSNEIKDAARRHAQMEHELDFDNIMSTVSERPVFVIYPVYRVEGRDAVENLYRRILPAPGHSELSLEALRALDDARVTSWGESHYIMEFDRAPERYPLHRGIAVSIHFDRSLVSEVYVYLTDPAAKEKITQSLDDEFINRRGITLL